MRQPASIPRHAPTRHDWAADYPRILATGFGGTAAASLRRISPRHSHGRRLTLAVALAAALGSGVAAQKAMMEWEGNAFPDLVAIVPGLAKPSPAPDRQAVFLARSTLMALSDANRSGNYSVLRDLAGPRFQARNSAEQLGHVFKAFRAANLDLSHAGMAEPRLTTAGVRDSDGLLGLEGDLPLTDAGDSHRIRFAMEFEAVAGHWRLHTLSVGMAPPL